MISDGTRMTGICKTDTANRIYTQNAIYCQKCVVHFRPALTSVAENMRDIKIETETSTFDVDCTRTKPSSRIHEYRGYRE